MMMEAKDKIELGETVWIQYENEENGKKSEKAKPERFTDELKEKCAENDKVKKIVYKDLKMDGYESDIIFVEDEFEVKDAFEYDGKLFAKLEGKYDKNSPDEYLYCINLDEERNSKITEYVSKHKIYNYSEGDAIFLNDEKVEIEEMKE